MDLDKDFFLDSSPRWHRTVRSALWPSLANSGFPVDLTFAKCNQHCSYHAAHHRFPVSLATRRDRLGIYLWWVMAVGTRTVVLL